MASTAECGATLKSVLCVIFLILSSALLSQITFTETEMSFMDMDAQLDVGDYDNDGDDDFVVIGGLLTSTLQRATRVYRNDNGVFINIQANLEPLVDGACHWGDFDNDGDLDLLLSGNYGTSQSTYGNGYVKIYINDNGTFTPTTHSFIQPFHNFSDWADYDNDGDLDIVIFGAFSSAIYRNDGGSFTNIGGIDYGWHGTSDWGDYDNDGDLDLVKAGYGPTSAIYRNNNGSFVNIGASIVNVEGACVKWGDFDNDGDLDLFISGASLDGRPPRYTKIYRNDNNVFVDSGINLLLLWGASAEWCDFDQDGDLDLAYSGTDGVSTRLVVYENIGGTFSQILQTSGGGGCKQKLEIGDFNNDGLQDIYTSGYFDQVLYAPKILFNTTAMEPPVTTQALNPMSFNMNGLYQEIDLSEYFSASGNTEFTFYNYQHVAIDLLPVSILRVQPMSDWYGTEYITIRATNSHGYVEQTLKVTVIQTWATLENFNNSGIIPTNWTTQHTGTTTYPWQPYQVSGTDYGMKTKAVTGTTVNERLLSPTYNLSGYKDIEVSFDTAFVPYGSGTGTFAYTLNNVTYTTVEIFSTSTSGIKTYTIPALDAKPSVRFRWNYVNGAANIGQENYWIVDNFQIFGLVRDVIAPTVVTGLETMALTSTSATLQWNPSSDVYFDKYEIYISTDAQVTTTDQLWSVLNDAMLNNANTIQTTVSPLATGNYWAAIRAVDQSGNASALSEVINFQIDGSAPVFSDPLPYNQPNPEWVNSLTATIGCTITDANQIDQNSIQYRIDANGNGIYDISEAWQAVTSTASYNIDRSSLNISVDVTYQVDGVLAYEFKAADLNGNIAYSGSNSNEGITDDWVVRLDTTSPVFSSPIPINQPNPTWTNNRTMTIGCSISDNLEIPLGSIEYRFDRNGNGNYDADEPWLQYSNQRQERNSRSQILVSVEVLFEADGLLHFEFRAMDQIGNVGYSGTSNAEGMSDDWMVRVYATPPVFSNPIPGNQPNPNWSTTRIVTIGASVASFDSTTTSVYYRYDSNGNGTYDPEEAWTPINQRNGIRTIRDRSAVTTQINFSSDGIFTFEFKAEDSLGNIGYSGLNGDLGIDDDWVVKINSNPPQITNLSPSNQPLPAWQISRTVIIEAEISSDVLLNEDSIRFRFDQNKNGVYDPDELWQTPVVTSNEVTRQNQIIIQAEIQVSSDGVYRFEIKASDQNGLTGYSGIQHLEGIVDDWVFRIDTIAPAAISNFFVEATTDNTIQLNWTASSDLNFLEYRVYYSLNPVVTIEDSMWCGADDPNLLASGSGLITTTISGLIPSTRYYFMVYAIDAAGLSTHYPSVITAMTTSSTQPASPQNVDLSVAGSLLIIDWDDVTTDVLGNLIGISYYEVHVGDNPYFTYSSETLISTVSESTLTLTDVVDYADRLFFKVIAVSGTIRKRE